MMEHVWRVRTSRLRVRGKGKFLRDGKGGWQRWVFGMEGNDFEGFNGVV